MNQLMQKYFNIYFRSLRAVSLSVYPFTLDLTVFWNSVGSDVPHLTPVAKRYIYTCFNSADAERSFIYNLVFSDRRRRLSEENSDFGVLYYL